MGIKIMEKNILIDHEERKILLCRKFAIKAKNTESKEFQQLCSVLQSFPEYKVERRTITKREKKESYKGLTYKYMESYIKLFSDSKTLDEYNNMRFLAECHSIRYPIIKQWFLNRFPEIKQFGATEEMLTELPNAV